MPQIHIGRGTTNLGVFEVKEVKSGLANGQFLITDLGWKEGMENWRPLSEFPELSEAPTHDQAPPLGEEEPTETLSADSHEPPTGEGLPWDHRNQIGVVQAFLETVKMVLTEPGRAFTEMNPESGLANPLVFGLIGGVIGGIVEWIYLRVFIHSQAFSSLPPKLKEMILQYTGADSLLWIPFSAVLVLFVGAGFLHLCLMLVGGARRPFETTFHVLCYSLGSANLLLLLPILGGTLSRVWGLIVGVIGLAKAHDIQTGRALAAVLLPVICCCAFLTALGVAAIFFMQAAR